MNLNFHNKNILFILICIFQQLICSSQVKIRVVNNENLGIPFTTVAWNKTNGLVTNEEGVVIIPNINDIDDSVLITNIGYQATVIYKKDINTNALNTIRINPQIIALPEVIVGSKLNISEMGYAEKKHRCFIVNFFENRAFETGVRIEGYKKMSFIEEVRIYIDNSSSGGIPFRLKVYDIQNELPGKSILNENLIVTNYKPGKWEKISVSHLNIQLPDAGFFVGIEWLITADNKGKLAVGADDWTNNEYRYVKMGNTGFIKLSKEKFAKKNKCIPAIRVTISNK